MSPVAEKHAHIMEKLSPEAFGYALSGISSSSMSSLSDRKNDRQSTNLMRPLLWASMYP